jgi:hypothetical protein
MAQRYPEARSGGAGERRREGFPTGLGRCGGEERSDKWGPRVSEGRERRR